MTSIRTIVRPCVISAWVISAFLGGSIGPNFVGPSGTSVYQSLAWSQGGSVLFLSWVDCPNDMGCFWNLRLFIFGKILYTWYDIVLYGTATNDAGLFRSLVSALFLYSQLLHSFNSDNLMTRIIFAYNFAFHRPSVVINIPISLSQCSQRWGYGIPRNVESSIRQSLQTFSPALPEHWSQGLKNFSSFSIQLNMKFIIPINTKLPAIKEKFVFE